MNFKKQVRIEKAKLETQALLDAANSYSPEFRKPAQIAFYEAHIQYLDALLGGLPCVAPVANTKDWNKTQLVLTAEANKE